MAEPQFSEDKGPEVDEGLIQQLLQGKLPIDEMRRVSALVLRYRTWHEAQLRIAISHANKEG